MTASWPEEHPPVYERIARAREWLPALTVLVLLGAALLGCAREGTRMPAETGGELAQSRSPVQLSLDPDAECLFDSTLYECRKFQYDLQKYMLVLDEVDTLPGQWHTIPHWLGNRPVRVSIHLIGDADPALGLLDRFGASLVGNIGREGCVPTQLTYCPFSRKEGQKRMVAHLPPTMLAPLSLLPEVTFVEFWEPSPNMSPYIQEIAVSLAAGLEHTQQKSSAIPVALLRPAHMAVVICWRDEGENEWGSVHFDAAIQWLEANGAQPYRMEPYQQFRGESSEADHSVTFHDLSVFMPISLLSPLSREFPEARIAGGGCYSHDPYGTRGPARLGHDRPFSIIPLGQVEDFTVFTNLSPSDKILLEASEGEDGGKVAIGSCDGDGQARSSFSHGEVVTLVACKPGDARVELYAKEEIYGRNVLWADDINVYKGSPESLLEMVPAKTYPIRHSLVKTGESLTLRLKTASDGPSNLRLTINEDKWYAGEGNLTFGDCPGEAVESIVLEKGDTITVTACTPGDTTIIAWEPRGLGGVEIMEPYGLWIWGEPTDYAQGKQDN